MLEDLGQNTSHEFHKGEKIGFEIAFFVFLNLGNVRRPQKFEKNSPVI